jgi:hypothetical protein
MLLGQSFTMNEDGTLSRTRLQVPYAYPADHVQADPQVTFGASSVPGKPAFLIAYTCWDGSSRWINFSYYRHDNPDDPGAYFSQKSLGTIAGPSDPNWFGDVTMAIVRNPTDGSTSWPYQILMTFQCSDKGFGLASLPMGPDQGNGPAIDFASLQMSQLI